MVEYELSLIQCTTSKRELRYTFSLNVCDWLNANKLTINAKKSNFVVFRPRQKRNQTCIRIPDNNNNGFVLLECKDYVKFLGVLIDKNLTWKPHIDHIASKMSKIVGILARIRHHVPLHIPLQIYHSLIFPYTLYGILVWGQASQRDLEKVLILQKRALRLIFFANKRSHAIPLFIASNILPVNMLYFETVSAKCMMFLLILHLGTFISFSFIHLMFIHIIRRVPLPQRNFMFRDPDCV